MVTPAVRSRIDLDGDDENPTFEGLSGNEKRFARPRVDLEKGKESVSPLLLNARVHDVTLGVALLLGLDDVLQRDFEHAAIRKLGDRRF